MASVRRKVDEEISGAFAISEKTLGQLEKVGKDFCPSNFAIAVQLKRKKQSTVADNLQAVEDSHGLLGSDIVRIEMGASSYGEISRSFSIVISGRNSSARVYVSVKGEADQVEICFNKIMAIVNNSKTFYSVYYRSFMINIFAGSLVNGAVYLLLLWIVAGKMDGKIEITWPIMLALLASSLLISVALEWLVKYAFPPLTFEFGHRPHLASQRADVRKRLFWLVAASTFGALINHLRP